jgi:hypothetical protein
VFHTYSTYDTCGEYGARRSGGTQGAREACAGGLGRLGSTVGLLELTALGAAHDVPVEYHDEYGC